MNIKPIKTETDYELTLIAIESLFDAMPNTPEGDELEILTTLLEAYEEKHYPIDFPDPVAAIEYTMESQGLSRKDLEVCLGSRARVSEILNHKRKLTLAMIKRLYEQFKIPAAVLIHGT